MVPRFTEFYIPVLRVLEDMKEHEINNLIEEVAYYCNLTEEDRNVLTRGATQPRYASNIQWAITDLYQAGFIKRPKRGVYKIEFEGLMMLEENPSHPDREYLASKSQAFKDFINRTKVKNSEQVSDTQPSIFSNDKNFQTSNDDESADEKEVLTTLNECYSLREQLVKLKIPTVDVNNKINCLKRRLLEIKLHPVVGKIVSEVYDRTDEKLGLIISLFEDSPRIYINCDASSFAKLTQSPDVFELAELKPNDKREESVKDKVTKERKEREPSKELTVVFADGTRFENDFASNIFTSAIYHIGSSKVASLGLQTSGMDLVGLTRPEKYNYCKTPDGFYVATNIPNNRKKLILEEIARRLYIDLMVFLSD